MLPKGTIKRIMRESIKNEIDDKGIKVSSDAVDEMVIILSEIIVSSTKAACQRVIDDGKRKTIMKKDITDIYSNVLNTKLKEYATKTNKCNMLLDMVVETVIQELNNSIINDLKTNKLEVTDM